MPTLSPSPSPWPGPCRLTCCLPSACAEGEDDEARQRHERIVEANETLGVDRHEMQDRREWEKERAKAEREYEKEWRKARKEAWKR